MYMPNLELKGREPIADKDWWYIYSLFDYRYVPPNNIVKIRPMVWEDLGSFEFTVRIKHK